MGRANLNRGIAAHFGHRNGEPAMSAISAGMHVRFGNRNDAPFSMQGGMDLYKTKLRAVGSRLVYQVLENKVVILVLSAGKHERNAAYKAVLDRLGDG